MEVTRTGPRSTMGRLATMLGGIEAGQTPLERRLGEFGNQVAIAILAIGVALIIGGLVVEGLGHLGPVVLFSVALAVAAVPEGLPAVLTLTLAMGVERLAKRKAVVRRLSAVEALGSVTVIATDKTGTLTENRMHVRAIDAPDPERALQAMVLANDAEMATGAGDPLEVALLHYAASQGTDPVEMATGKPRLSSRAFDSAAKFMRVTVEEGGNQISYLKGAPEVLIERSSLSAQDKRNWEDKAQRHASQGYPRSGSGLVRGGARGARRVPWIGDAVGPAAPGGARGSQASQGSGHPRGDDHGRPRRRPPKPSARRSASRPSGS